TASFANKPAPALAQAVKVTDPAGFQQGWEMILTGPGTPSTGEKVSTDATGVANFLTQLQEGSYTIDETQQTGWTEESATGECSFSVNYPANGGHTYVCTITNRTRGHIIVKKVTVPSGSSQSFTFTPSYNGGTTFDLTDAHQNDSGALVPGDYNVSEGSTAGWGLTSATCGRGCNSPPGSTLGAGQTVICTFPYPQRGHIRAKKVTVPSGSSQSFTFTPSYNGGTTFDLTDAHQNDSGALVPGNYSVSEGSTAGWDLTSATCDGGGNRSASITLGGGTAVGWSFTNPRRGDILVKKGTERGGGGQRFT